MKNNKRVIIGLLILFVLFSVIMFAVPLAKNGLFWISYVFGVVAIAVQAYVFHIAFAKGDNLTSKLYGFPIARIGVIYLIVQLSLSIIFMITAQWVPIWIPLILYVVALGLAGLGLIATQAMKEEIDHQDEEIKKDVKVIRSLQSKALYLVNQCGSEALVTQLEMLNDNLKYSDPVTSEDTLQIENDLLSCMEEISSAVAAEENENATVLIKRFLSTLAERNRLCKLSK